MVRLTTKTLDQILEAARELLQDSTVTEIYEFAYQAGVTTYKLPGFADSDPRVLSIEAIEGINFIGNWVTEDDLVVGVDYDIWQLNGEVEAGYGASSGQNHYEGITITTLTFQDNSTVYIRYKYQVPDFRPVLTNFAGNSQILMFLSAVFSNVQQDLVTLAGSMDSFGINATGDNLRRLGTIAALVITDATKTTGTIQITNSDASESFSISSATRFVARAGSSFIQFKAVSGAGTVGPDSIANIAIVAVTGGKFGNVGSYSIVEVFEDVGLTTLAPSYITVTNPPLISGQPNYFDNGTDEEDEAPFRSRIQLTFHAAKTSSYSTIEKAAFDTGFLTDVTAYDINNRKGIVVNNNVMVLQTPYGNILSGTTLTIIRDAVLAVAGTGQLFRFEQTMNAYLSMDVDIFVDTATLEDTTDLEAQIIATLTNHINSQSIGADIFPSTLLALIISSVSVRDATINSTTLTEYVSEVALSDTEFELFSEGLPGTLQNEFIVELHFNSIKWSEVDQYDGANAFLDVANTPIDERIDPRVNIAVLDYNNEYRASPLNIFDYFDTVTVASSRINYEIAPAGQTPIVQDNYLIFDYNQYDQVVIDGVRVLLNGIDGQFVDIELRVGATADGATLVHSDTQISVTLDGNEVPKIYEFEFLNPQTLDPTSNRYWLHISSGSSTSLVTLPMDTANTPVAFDPEAHVDGQAETVPAAPDGTFERIYARATYHAYFIKSGADAYDKIVIPSKSRYSESSRLYETTLNFVEFVEE